MSHDDTAVCEHYSLRSSPVPSRQNTPRNQESPRSRRAFCSHPLHGSNRAVEGPLTILRGVMCRGDINRCEVPEYATVAATPLTDDSPAFVCLALLGLPASERTEGTIRDLFEGDARQMTEVLDFLARRGYVQELPQEATFAGGRQLQITDVGRRVLDDLGRSRAHHS